MTLTIVPIYAAIFAIVYAALSFRVADSRRTLRIALGMGGNATLERRVRVHGNFAEYVPFLLILLSFVELQGWPRWLLHVLCLAMLAARLLHAYGVSGEPEDIRFRATGMVTTLLLLVAAAVLLLIGAWR